MTTNPAAAGTLGAGTPTWAHRLGRARAKRRAYRTTLAELTALTEHQLRDIGMTRDALPEIARRAAQEI